ncbi:MAG TPA: pilin [Candidatus Paceibacterota bacterium]
MKGNENPEGLEEFDSFITKIEDQILEPIIALVAVAAFLVFAWGVIEFIQGAGDEEKRRVGRQHMLWGILGLVIVFGASILVRIITNIAT